MLQLGGMFACAPNVRHHARFAWNRLMSDITDEKERQQAQMSMDASKKALYHQTGQKVSCCWHLTSNQVASLVAKQQGSTVLLPGLRVFFKMPHAY